MLKCFFALAISKIKHLSIEKNYEIELCIKSSMLTFNIIDKFLNIEIDGSVLPCSQFA